MILNGGLMSAIDGGGGGSSLSCTKRKGLKANGKSEDVKTKKCKEVSKVGNSNGKDRIWPLLVTTAVVCVLYLSGNFTIKEQSSSKVAIQLKSFSNIKNVTDPREQQFMAKADEYINGVRFHQVKCNYRGYRKEKEKWDSAPGRCGTIVSDSLVSEEEALALRRITKKMLKLYGFQDIENPESLNIKRVKLYEVFSYGYRDGTLAKTEYELINKTGMAIMKTVADYFKLEEPRIYFTSVSEMTRFKPVTAFQEFRHVDKVRAPALLVTTIVWLSTTGVDFEGGRTEYLTGGPEPFTPLLVEPKLGRFAAWTSGWENPHGVQEMESGERFALLFAVTANPQLGYKNIEELFYWSDYLVKD